MGNAFSFLLIDKYQPTGIWDKERFIKKYGKKDVDKDKMIKAMDKYYNMLKKEFSLDNLYKVSKMNNDNYNKYIVMLSEELVDKLSEYTIPLSLYTNEGEFYAIAKDFREVYKLPRYEWDRTIC